MLSQCVCAERQTAAADVLTAISLPSTSLPPAALPQMFTTMRSVVAVATRHAPQLQEAAAASAALFRLPCAACGANERQVVFLPCGHLIACVSCGQRAILCAQCNNPVRSVLTVYRFIPQSILRPNDPAPAFPLAGTRSSY